MLLVSEGRPLSHIARLFQTAPHRLRAWRTWFLACGRAELADAPRPGRRPKRDPTALRFLEEAIGRSPQDYGLLSAAWTVRDLAALLASQRGVAVAPATGHRALLAQGYRHRRPRHDLWHRQDSLAVAAARHVLVWLNKRVPQILEGFDWSMWMHVQSTPTPAGKGLAEAGPPDEGTSRGRRP